MCGACVYDVVFLFDRTFNIFPSKREDQEENKSIGVAFFCVGGVSWLTLYIAERILGVDIIDGIRALFCQLVTGHAYHVNAPLWYMAVLIWTTILFYVLFLSNSKGSIYIVHVLSFVALIMQYTGFNYSLFKDFPFEVKFPLGRIAEMMPYATIGYDFSRFDLLERMRTTPRRKWYMWTALIMTIVLLCLGKEPKTPGYGYAGLFRICVSICFFLLNFDAFPYMIKRALIVIEKHTLGIYCMHYIVGNTAQMILSLVHISINPMAYCVLIYIVCYIIATMISKVPSKYIQQLVD